MIPSVSVVIPCHNAQGSVGKAIESALEQSGQFSLRVIVVDDGSTDGSVEILQSFAGRITTIRQDNRGGGAARNRGLREVEGDFVKFLDADDWLLPGSIARQFEVLSESGVERTIVCGYAVEVDLEGKRVGDRKMGTASGEYAQVAMLLRQGPLTSCPLHPVEAVRQVGGFDSKIPRGQETEFHLRLGMAGFKFLFHDDPVYCYRVPEVAGGNITSGRYTKFGREFPRIYEQHLAALCRNRFGERLPTEIARALAMRCWDAGRGVLREGADDEARHLFALSRDFQPGAETGSLLYRTLASSLGPFRAERWTGRMKQWLRSE